ncbi:unnamed protein product [Adineta steineri]|uniref:TIR domain-containing protein n=1 Tax=Adineta steineri TaxID=433720 RepID=A0A815CHH0_9BILA|nr:unnamed protein product [Adineta steineri]CAF1566577.1 unnamed protein product [Adineta steineri]
MSTSLECNSLLQQTLSGDEQISVEDTSEEPNGTTTDNMRTNESIISTDCTLTIVNNTIPNDQTDAIVEPLSSLDSQQNSNNKQGTTTTDISPNTERHISQWSEDEVLGWFQSYNLDGIHKYLFARHEKKDGTMLAKLFECKVQNCDLYRKNYGGRLPSKEKNLLKDFDRFGQQLDSLFIDKLEHRFDVAFSFPGDIRERVSHIAEKLCKKINTDGQQRVFYDMYHKAELARPNLDLYLQTIYRYQTKLIVVFMCDEYSRREWCGLEARAIRSLMKTYQNSRIMLLSVDGKAIEGVLDIDGYLDISEKKDDDNDVVDAIYTRLIALENPQIFSKTSHPPILENRLSRSITALKHTFRSISPWYFVVALASYIVGTFDRQEK